MDSSNIEISLPVYSLGVWGYIPHLNLFPHVQFRWCTILAIGVRETLGWVCVYVMGRKSWVCNTALRSLLQRHKCSVSVFLFKMYYNNSSFFQISRWCCVVSVGISPIHLHLPAQPVDLNHHRRRFPSPHTIVIPHTERQDVATSGPYC